MACVCTVVSECGELIGGRYRLTEVLGSGAMGVVWRARDERLNRVVAIKLLTEGSSPEASREASARAVREARLTARLRHPHVIAVHDVTEHGGRPCLVMEYLPARSLSEVVEAEGVLSPRRAAAIGAQVAAGLAAAHEAGVLHRDVKPDNVLLTEDGTAKIADFGIARVPGDSSVTAVGILVGTPAYLAPEVAKGGQGGFAADVFSLGSTLYAALEGRPPFGMADNAIALLHVVAACEVAPPRRAGFLGPLLMEMLRADPLARPSMAEVARRLELSLPADTQPMPAPEPARIPRQRRASMRVAAAIGGLVVAAGVVVAARSLVRVQVSAVSGAPPSVVTLPAAASATTTSVARPVSAGCEARYVQESSWSTGYQVAVVVTNRGAQQLSGWEVSWTLPGGHRISSLWNGQVVQRGSVVTVRNASWNAVLAAHGSTSFGLVGSALGDDPELPPLRCTSR
ncbi:hypothetical protein KALB_4351 [Kutzneria albida DSM 43870]|uniref:non-specific serine/threonine protein kinase n=1 Tax=Kutzneria albida DSM 43870 TaxID=1449976 RepID=W5W9C4_9PSEU|nr:hypothetical protein KALB_4351 [Kutzneria albida DSM 43870]